MRQNACLLALPLVLALMGCTRLHAYRTQPPPDNQIRCSPNDVGEVPGYCAHLLTEVAKSYRLHFAEFDDQGRPYPDPADASASEFQLERFLEQVEIESDEKPLSVVVFVHGWLHSARTDDDNLKSFRVLLDQLSQVEANGPCKRSLVGLYVGWRGAGVRLSGHPWNTPTFWSRKLAAEHIADGSFQQILAGLKAIQQKAPDAPINLSRAPGEADCSARIKSTYVGHSFGGQIIMSSLAQDFARSLMVDRANMTTRVASSQRSVAALDELAIVINPAVESARFDALYRVARETRYPSYRTPRFIAITSVNDWPTRTMFPLGRVLNTSTKQYPKGDRGGRQAARKTVGHDINYLTHRLSVAMEPLSAKGAEELETCRTWHGSQGSFTTLAKIETEAAAKFHHDQGGNFDANLPQYWPRYFCSRKVDADPLGMILLERLPTAGPDANSPIWNIQTARPILSAHSDITNVKLIEFLRQVYIDSMFFR